MYSLKSVFLPLIEGMHAVSRTFVALLSILLTGLPFSAAAVEEPRLMDVIIRFHDRPGVLQEALVRKWGTVKNAYHLVPAMSARLPEQVVSVLARHPLVVSIDEDGEIYALDAELDNVWGVKRIGAGTVQESGNTGEAVKVAIIDSGIDCTHPDLSANCAGGYDFVNNDGNPADDNSHGTHVAGTVAAIEDNAGVVGVAPTVALYALKVLNANGSGNWSDVIEALQWAVDNGIQVTNNSYGSSSNPGSTLELAFANAEAAGVLHIAAAGNSGRCNGIGDRVGYPAKYDSVVAVAATDSSDKRACFSSTGPKVELAAPGVSINSTKMGGGYVVYSGTSMASPHVAGVAALVLKAGVSDGNGNGRVNDDARSVLISTADDLGAAGRDTWYGFGLVNAVAAVASITPPPPPGPAVSVALSTDKDSYVSGTDTQAVVTAVLQDENGAAIGGLFSSAFATLLDAVPVSLAFAETVTPGTYSASLDLTALADGVHAVDVTVTDTRGVSGNESTSFDLVPPPETAVTVSVVSITYALTGGFDSRRDLLITHTAKDNLGNAVANATISTRLSHASGSSWTGSARTGGDGTVTFKLRSAPTGCYTSLEEAVSATGLIWDGVTPSNGFCK